MSAREYGSGGIVEQKNTADQPGTAVLVATAASTPIVAERANRTHLFISNIGANNVFLRFASAGAAVNQGVLLAPDAVLPLSGYTGPVSGRAATADTTVAVAEI